MALTDFYESGPYVHSHLFNFRANVGEILQTPSKDAYKESIDRLKKVRDNLEREARIFLDMRGTDS